jgi:hypothetical protein
LISLSSLLTNARLLHFQVDDLARRLTTSGHHSLCSLRGASHHPSFSHARAVAEDSHPWRSGMKVKRSIDFVKPSLLEASVLILPTCSLFKPYSTFSGG